MYEEIFKCIGTRKNLDNCWLCKSSLELVFVKKFHIRKTNGKKRKLKLNLEFLSSLFNEN